MDDLVIRRTITRLIVRRCRLANVDVIVGVADPSMVWSCWVAEALSLPAAYIRTPKSYGRRRVIEGATTKDRRVAFIIDGHDVTQYIPQLEAESVKIIDVRKYLVTDNTGA